MSVRFRCGCGEQLEVDDEHAGQQVECPACHKLATAPAAGPTLAKPATRPAGGAEAVDPPTRRVRDVEDDEGDRPRRKKAEEKPKHTGFFGTESWILSGGVVGGLIAMAVAVVWFVVGLLADRIFFYPPVLFLVGLFGFVKGLMKRGEE